jgi:hypothetical protein
MKFKFLLLSMLGAAAIVSCNNDSIIGGDPVPKPDENGFVASTGKETYFSVKLPESLKTYAGEGDVVGEAYEMYIKGDVAIFVYKWENGNATPEAYAYIAPGSSSPAALGTPITMKVTDGTKKIYVALNIGAEVSGVSETFFSSLGTGLFSASTTAGEGTVLPVVVTQNALLTDLIWSAGTGGWTKTVAGTQPAAANGLIKAFAGGSFITARGFLSTPTTTPPNPSSDATNAPYFLLSNWDNSKPDVSNPGTTYTSTCIFTFLPDVPKTDAPTHAQNNANIRVQRAVAKIGLKFSDLIKESTNAYLSETDGESKGRFTPWLRSGGTEGVWALGNINKVSTVFQQFSGDYYVADANYSAADSCNPAAPGGNGNWYKNFDNTRIYGSNLSKGYRAGATVSSVKDTILGTKNGDPNSVMLGATNYQYCTENALNHGIYENATYVLVGGVYTPQYWISNIKQANVVSNAPITAYNGASIPGTAQSGEVYGHGTGDAYSAVPYPSTPGGTDADSIYYHKGFKVFIYGKSNLPKYYGWVKSVGGTAGKESTQPENVQAITDSISADFASKQLVKYFQGNCFYRVYVEDAKASSSEQLLVRRNHIYDITINKITGPGIADPNDILIPGSGKPKDTYMAVTISVQNWHKVVQGADVEDK